MGDPFQSHNVADPNTPQKKIDLRLASGQYNFPFSFPFPTHADPITGSSESILDTNSISPFPLQAVGTAAASPTPPQHDNGSNITEKSPRRWSRHFTSAPHESSSSRSQTLSPTLGSAQGPSSASPMPQTFMERGINPIVAYDISVRIAHGRFKPSSK
jgi:hypothetical protein